MVSVLSVASCWKNGLGRLTVQVFLEQELTEETEQTPETVTVISPPFSPLPPVEERPGNSTGGNRGNREETGNGQRCLPSVSLPPAGESTKSFLNRR